jgi:hypothetical protein
MRMLWVKLAVTFLLLFILVVGSFWVYDSYKPLSLPTVEEENAVEPEKEIRSTFIQEAAPPPEQVRVDEIPDAKIKVSGKMMNHAYPGLSDVHVPAVGAEIRAVLKIQRGWSRERKVLSKSTISTDERGGFFFAFDDPGFRPVFVTLTAGQDDLYRGQARTVEIREGTQSLKDIVLTRLAFGVLEGETVDSEGLPLAGVRVRIGGDGQKKVVYSDGQGRFSVTGLTRTGGTSASLDGYIVYSITMTGSKKGGGWKPIRIVLVPAGRLLVHLEGSEGMPLAGRSVRIGVSNTEPKPPGTVIPYRDELCIGTTDSSGTARFDGLWTGKKLRITVQMPTRQKSAERMLSGRLVYEGREVKGSPIVIPRSGLLEVTAGEAFYFELRGTVYFPDHRPVPTPRVKVHDLDEPAWKKRRMQVRSKGDEQGRYSMRIPEGENRARLEVTAIDLGGWGNYWPKFEHAGRAEVLVKNAREGVLEQDLVLEPVLSISGCVLDAARKPAHGKVHAVPAGSGYLRASTSLGMEAYSWIKEEGAFSLQGLPSGSYDLYATQELKRGSPHITACHLFPGIEAGSHGLELVMPEKRSVTIRINVQAEEGRLNRLAVLHSKFIPRPGWKTSAPSAPRSMMVSSLTDWPSRTPMRQVSSNRYQDARGYHIAAFYSTGELDNHQLPAMEEGWYIVGVEGFDENGHAYYPVATRLMHFAPGNYTISFKLVPTTSVEGRVHLQGDTRALYLSLKDSNGISLFFKTRAPKATNFLPVGGDGSFLMSQVPVGRFTLCVGTVDDLSHGRSVVEKPVHIMAGKNPFLEIRLP